MIQSLITVFKNQFLFLSKLTLFLIYKCGAKINYLLHSKIDYEIVQQKRKRMYSPSHHPALFTLVFYHNLFQTLKEKKPHIATASYIYLSNSHFIPPNYSKFDGAPIYPYFYTINIYVSTITLFLCTWLGLYCSYSMKNLIQNCLK